MTPKRGVSAIIDEALAGEHPPSHGGGKKEAAPRQGAMAKRVAGIEEAGRMAKRPAFYLAPEMCSIFPGNARDYDNLTYEKLGSLVSSIIETKGNTYAVLARRTGDADKPYEIIAGSRRQ